MVLGSGVERGRLVKLGHWWGARWDAGGEHRGEVLLAGEALHLPVEDVFEVLLHEAAHGINAARGVKDTSRGGRYHNSRFKATAAEVGLAVEAMPPYGWAKTSLTSATAERYGAEIDDLRNAIRIALRIDGRTLEQSTGSGAETSGGNGSSGRGSSSVAMVCGCERRVRMTPSVAAQGPVNCGVCGSEFEMDGAHQSSNRPGASAQPEAPDPDVASTESAVDRHQEFRDRATRWAEEHGELLDEPLVADGDVDVAMLNVFARAARQDLGQIDDVSIDAGPLRLAVGDQVIVATRPDEPGIELPEPGVLGLVTAVDGARNVVEVDFPMAGIYQLSAGDAGRSLDYGYSTVAVDLDRPLRSPSGLMPVIEPPGFGEVEWDWS